jgi:hypothetical protein
VVVEERHSGAEACVEHSEIELHPQSDGHGQAEVLQQRAFPSVRLLTAKWSSIKHPEIQSITLNLITYMTHFCAVKLYVKFI